MNTKPTLCSCLHRFHAKQKHVTWLYKPCWQANFEGLRMAGFWIRFVDLDETFEAPYCGWRANQSQWPSPVNRRMALRKARFQASNHDVRHLATVGEDIQSHNLGKQSGGFESLPKKGTCFTQNERNPLQVHLIILKSLASSPSSLHCKLFLLVLFEHLLILLTLSSLVHFLIEHNTTNRWSCHFQTLSLFTYTTLWKRPSLCKS